MSEKKKKDIPQEQPKPEEVMLFLLSIHLPE